MRKLQNNKINDLYKFLNQHTIDNLNILGQLDNEPNSEIWVNDGNIITGVLIKSPHSNTFQFNTYDDDIIIEAVNDVLCNYDYVLMSAIREGLCEKLFPFGHNQDESIGNYCLVYYYNENSVDLSDVPSYIKPIDIMDADIIDYFYTYRHSGSIDTIKHDINARPSAAAYIDNQLASWVLLHEDNSMGIMYTRPEYRGKELAYFVTKFLMNKIINKKQIPFVHIVEGNNASVKLTQKCKMKYGLKVLWFDYKFNKITKNN